MKELTKTFKITTSEVKYFIGLEIKQNKPESSIEIRQSSYIRQIVKRFGLEDVYPIKTPADPYASRTEGRIQNSSRIKHIDV